MKGNAQRRNARFLSSAARRGPVGDRNDTRRVYNCALRHPGDSVPATRLALASHLPAGSFSSLHVPCANLSFKWGRPPDKGGPWLRANKKHSPLALPMYAGVNGCSLYTVVAPALYILRLRVVGKKVTVLENG